MTNSFYQDAVKVFDNLDYKSYMREYLGKDAKYLKWLYDRKYYFIACEFMAMLEEFDRFISNERDEFEPTSAYLRNGYERSLSNKYRKCLKDTLIYKYDLRWDDWDKIDEEIFNHKNYSAQRWIDEYKILNEEREVK